MITQGRIEDEDGGESPKIGTMLLVSAPPGRAGTCMCSARKPMPIYWAGGTTFEVAGYRLILLSRDMGITGGAQSRLSCTDPIRAVGTN